MKKKYYDRLINGKSFQQSEGSPHHYDALLSDCTFHIGKHSVKEYDDMVKEDIEDLIRLTPEGLKWKRGVLRGRNFVTPLLVACRNVNIPIESVELLLRKGANPEETIEFKMINIKTIVDLKENIPKKRYNQIKAIFKKNSKKIDVPE